MVLDICILLAILQILGGHMIYFTALPGKRHHDLCEINGTRMRILLTI